MRLETEYNDGCLLIRFSGDLDHHAAGAAYRESTAAIDRYLPYRCFLDFSGVTFMDSSGIAVVLRLKKRMEEAEGKLLVLDPAPQCAKVLRTSGVGRYVDIKFREGNAVR